MPLRSTPGSGREQNQHEHDTASNRPRKPLATSSRKLPPLNPQGSIMDIGQTISLDDRLNHAEKARAELRKMDKDRLRKQREEREVRSRRALDNNQIEMPTAPSIETIHQHACPPIGPKQRSTHPKIQKQKVKAKVIEYNPQLSDLNELFIGHH